MDVVDTIRHKWFKRPYRLAYIEAGAGIPVVLVHGLGASKAIWRPLVNLLQPDKYHVVMPDLLGFGESPRPQWNEYNVEEHARMVMAFLKMHKIIWPVTLVGHSMGCLVSAHIAAVHPSMVRHLILYEPPLLGEFPDFPKQTRRSNQYKALFEYIASHPQLASLESTALWKIARKISGLYLTEEDWVPFERSLRNTIMKQGAYQELRSLPIKTDIIYGRLDFIVIRQGIKDLFKRNTNIRLHLVTDVHGISARSARFLTRLIEASYQG